MQTIKFMDGRTLYACEKFTSVYEFIHTVDNRPLNELFSTQPESELTVNEVDDKLWSGSRTYADSVRTFRNGYAEGMEHIRKHMTLIVNPVPKPRNVESIVGEAVHIPNFVKGLPNHMIMRKRQKQPVPMVNIYFDRGIRCSVSSDEIFRYSRILLQAVRHMESLGIHVGLNVIVISCADRNVCGFSVNIKGNHDPLNPLKVSYPLVHTSFFRRQFFRWQETSPIIICRDYLYGRGFAFQDFMSDASIRDRHDSLVKAGFFAANDIYLDSDTLSNVKSAEELISKIESLYGDIHISAAS